MVLASVVLNEAQFYIGWIYFKGQDEEGIRHEKGWVGIQGTGVKREVKKQIKEIYYKPGEMTQVLRALFALWKDWNSIPSTSMACHNSLYIQFQGIWYPHTNTHAIKLKKLFFLKRDMWQSTS